MLNKRVNLRTNNTFMRKTVLAIFVKLLFSFSASAQTHTDSAQNILKPSFLLKDTSHAASFFRVPVLSSNYYASHLPFFCTSELKLQKAVKMSVKFRLGSVDYCNKLEGKP